MSCPAIVGGYTKPCRDSQGGVKKFYATERSNISSYTVVSGVLTAITMSPGKKFWLYEQDVNISKFDENPTPSRANGSYFVDQTFFCKFRKRGAALSYSLKALGQQDLAIIEVEQTGEMFLGGLVNGMALEPSTSSTGTAAGDSNGYELTFKGQEPEMAPTISQVILDTIIV
jgi:hypothetical protein